MANQNNTEPTLESLIGRPGPPPLRIHHLMAATAVAAALLSVQDISLSTFRQSGAGIVYILATAVSATLVMFGFWWRRHGHVFFDLPGHWLLLEQSLMASIFLLAALSALARKAGIASSDRDLSGIVAVWFLALNAMSFGLNIWAAFKVADSRAWRALFLFQGTRVPLLFALGSFGIEVIKLIPLGSLLLLTMATVGDWKAGRRRDWPHWIGVFLAYSVNLIFYIQQLWSWFLVNVWGA